MNKRLFCLLLSIILVVSNITTAMADTVMADSVVKDSTILADSAVEDSAEQTDSAVEDSAEQTDSVVEDSAELTDFEEEISIEELGEASVKVNFKANSGQFDFGDPGYIDVTPGVNYGMLPSVSRAGYNFNGWFTAISGGSKIESSTVCTLTTNHTLYAQWSPINYTIRYDANGATGSMADEAATYGVAHALHDNSFTKTGYKFVGWSDSPGIQDIICTNKAIVNNLTTVDSDIVTLFAQWRPIEYIIKFNKNASDAKGTMPDQTIKYDEATDLSANTFTRAGYILKGWSTSAGVKTVEYADKETVNNLTTTDRQTITLYAQWTPVKYYIRYNKNSADAIGSMPDTETTYEDRVTLSANQYAQPGYTFKFWSTAVDGSGTNYPDKATVSKLCTAEDEVITLYAQWKAHEYTIQFIGNGSDSGSMGNYSLSYGERINLPANEYVKKGYDFVGWNTAADGSGLKSYSDKHSVINLLDTDGGVYKLYAQWKPINYTIIYDKNSTYATGSMPNTLATYNSSVTLSENKFVREGYTFEGWSETAPRQAAKYQDKEVVSNLTQTSGGTVTLYAQWKPVKYKIAFDKNAVNAVGSKGDVEVEYDETFTLPEKAFTMSENRIISWNTQSDGLGTSYGSNQSVSNLTSVSGNTVTLYAQWGPSRYSVIYHKNAPGVEGTMADKMVEYNQTVSLDANTYTKTGYVFEGWSDDAYVNTVKYADGASIHNLSDVEGAMIDLYAQWKPVRYKILYDKNSALATGSMVNSEAVYDTPKTLSANSFARTGYTFGGFNTRPDGSGTTYADQSEVLNLAATEGAEVTLYAKWNENSYAIRFNGNNNTAGNMASVIANYDELKSLPFNEFARTGYTFVTWNTAADGSGADYANNEAVSQLCAVDGGTVDLYAQWEPISYTVKYNANAELVSGSMADTNAEYDRQFALSENAFAKTGYKFLGWSKSAGNNIVEYTDKASVENLSAVYDGVVNLYAQWTPITYTIAFDGNGNDGGNTVSQNFLYDASTDLADNGFTKTGYRFIGWNTAADGSGQSYSVGTPINNLSATDGDVITFYARWTEVGYKVRFNKNAADATGTMDDMSFTFEESKALSLNTFEREGYVFDGWSKYYETSEKHFSDGEVVSHLASTENAVFFLYARWRGNPHTLTYDANGGIVNGGATDSIVRKTGERYGALPYPSKEGLNFVGWYTEPEGGEQVTMDTLMANADVTIYAQYRGDDINTPLNPPDKDKKKEDNRPKEVLTLGNGNKIYTGEIIYELNGGVLTNGLYTKKASGSTVRLNKPVKDGYTFKCWRLNGKKIGAINARLLQKGKVNIYAEYVENQYTIKYTMVPPVKGAWVGKTPKAEKYLYSKPVTFPGDLYASDMHGKVFKLSGWSTTPNGPVEYTSEDKDVCKLAGITRKDRKIVLYSVWED